MYAARESRQQAPRTPFSTARKNGSKRGQRKSTVKLTSWTRCPFRTVTGLNSSASVSSSPLLRMPARIRQIWSYCLLCSLPLSLPSSTKRPIPSFRHWPVCKIPRALRATATQRQMRHRTDAQTERTQDSDQISASSVYAAARTKESPRRICSAFPVLAIGGENHRTQLCGDAFGRVDESPASEVWGVRVRDC